MPRISLKESEYRCKDITRLIVAEAKEQKISQERLGEEIDLSQSRVSKKLRTSDLSLLETIKLLKLIGYELCITKGD